MKHKVLIVLSTIFACLLFIFGIGVIATDNTNPAPTGWFYYEGVSCQCVSPTGDYEVQIKSTDTPILIDHKNVSITYYMDNEHPTGVEPILHETQYSSRVFKRDLGFKYTLELRVYQPFWTSYRG